VYCRKCTAAPDKENGFFFKTNLDCGSLYLRRDEEGVIYTNDVGDLNLLSGGIYVCEVKSDRFLPHCLSFLSGTIDLALGSLDLAASREAFITNGKYDSVVQRIAAVMGQIVRALVDLSKATNRDYIRYLLCQIYDRLGEVNSDLFFESVGRYEALMRNGKTLELKRSISNDVIYIYTPSGPFCIASQ
jgi:hypothetical protein